MAKWKVALYLYHVDPKQLNGKDLWTSTCYTETAASMKQ